MALEVWGTYSVRDHLDPRAFIADVLLYDRLVIPVPPEEEVDNWQEDGWDPASQKAILSILGDDLARSVPWGQSQRAVYQGRVEAERARVGEAAARAIAHHAVADAVGYDAHAITAAKAEASGPQVDTLHVTRLVLVDYTDQRRDRQFFDRHPDVYVEPVAAYPSHAAFVEGVPVEPINPEAGDGPQGPPPDEGLAGVFGWEFFVPADSARSGEDLLADAAELSRRGSFRKARSDYHEWRRDAARFRLPPETARAEMERRIGRYRDETARIRGKTALTYGFAVAGGLVSIAGALIFPPVSVLGGFISLASVGVKLLPGDGLSPDARPAAMFADARRHFGWRPPAR